MLLILHTWNAYSTRNGSGWVFNVDCSNSVHDSHHYIRRGSKMVSEKHDQLDMVSTRILLLEENTGANLGLFGLFKSVIGQLEQTLGLLLCTLHCYSDKSLIKRCLCRARVTSFILLEFFFESEFCKQCNAWHLWIFYLRRLLQLSIILNLLTRTRFLFWCNGYLIITLNIIHLWCV